MKNSTSKPNTITGSDYKASGRSLRRFSLNHAVRSKITSMLLIILASIFIFSLLWMNYLMIKNNDIIEKTYKNYTITADINLKENALTKAGTGVISYDHIDKLMETGLVEDYKVIALLIYDELYRDRNGLIEQYEVGEKDKVHFYTYDPVFKVEASNKPYNDEDGTMNLLGLNFLEGYSLEDLYKEYRSDYSNQRNPKIVDENGEEGFPILVSEEAMDHFDLELGDKIYLKPGTNHLRLVVNAYGTVVGTFEGVVRGSDRYGITIRDNKETFIYPISVLEAIEHKLYYNKVEFIFKSENNKELMERKAELNRIISNNPLNEVGMELNFWDGEIVNVVEPLEKNISLLEILYPVTLVMSIAISGILGFMMVVRRSTDVAILRVLGVKTKEVQWNLFRENIVLVVIGIIISCGLIIGITANTYPIGIDKYAIVVGGYLLGTIVGLLVGIIKVTNKKPLEMLQVKE